MDHALFLSTLSTFARVLPARYEIKPVLIELTTSVVGVLGIHGSGVTLAKDGKLRFVTGFGSPYEELERVQERYQRGPCQLAFESGMVVSVADVRARRDEWPEYALAAERSQIAAVAGVPIRLADEVIGSLNLYDREPREWVEEDLAAAGVLADVVTGYLVNASKLRQQHQLNEQLQHALSARVVIEQAKGVIAAERHIGVEQAFELIRQHARRHNTTARAVAEAIVSLGLRV